jgi:hypothetical protein
MPTRASAPTNSKVSGVPVINNLGGLVELPGFWAGDGFNLIQLPDFDSRPPSTGPQDFRVKVSTTREILEFAAIGAPVPNRGGIAVHSPVVGQNDIQIFGVSYLQRIWDAADNSALHLEPGFWLNVPATTFPKAPASIVRLGSIPHGATINAQGTSSVISEPIIGDLDSTPVHNPNPSQSFPIGYLDPLLGIELPSGVPPDSNINPNLVLIAAISGQNIVNTVVLQVTAELGSVSNGITNIPFLTANARVTRFSATFWIETVLRADGTAFMQLQYTQTAILNFLGIDWPHISVATLVKQ